MTMNVALSDELADFVRSEVAAGRYGSSSEVVHEALRLLEKVEHSNAENLRNLRQAWRDGIDSGIAEEIDFTALKAEARQRVVAPKT